MKQLNKLEGERGWKKDFVEKLDCSFMHPPSKWAILSFLKRIPFYRFSYSHLVNLILSTHPFLLLYALSMMTFTI